jgi:tetratricopeptide (TPR) repeat protein
METMARKPFPTIRLLILSAALLFPALSVSAQDKPDAQALYSNKQYEEAVNACLQILADTPKDMDAYSILGLSQLALKRYDEAAKYAEDALTIARYDRRILLIAGDAYYNLGKNDMALKYLEEFANIATSDKRIKDVYYFMGEIYLRLGEFSNADIAFSTALYYDNNVADWWARAGYAREMAKDYIFSLDAYNKALLLNPNFAEAQRGAERVKKLLGR